LPGAPKPLVEIADGAFSRRVAFAFELCRQAAAKPYEAAAQTATIPQILWTRRALIRARCRDSWRASQSVRRSRQAL